MLDIREQTEEDIPLIHLFSQEIFGESAASEKFPAMYTFLTHSGYTERKEHKGKSFFEKKLD